MSALVPQQCQYIPDSFYLTLSIEMTFLTSSICLDHNLYSYLYRYPFKFYTKIYYCTHGIILISVQATLQRNGAEILASYLLFQLFAISGLPGKATTVAVKSAAAIDNSILDGKLLYLHLTLGSASVVINLRCMKSAQIISLDQISFEHRQFD